MQDEKFVRRGIAIAVGTAGAIYVVCAVLGIVPPDQHLQGADIAIIVLVLLVVSILLRPEMLDRLTQLKLLGVEVELTKLQETQEKQRQELNDARLVLALLLGESERRHLLNLKAERTREYEGRGSLRAELRRLRDLRLVESLRPIGEIRTGNKFDLREFVRLTTLGEQYIERLTEHEKEQQA